MRDGERESEAISQLRLDFGFPSATAIAIAAAAVGEDEELVGMQIAPCPLLFPPSGNAMGGEGGRIVRDTDEDGTAIGEKIIDAIRSDHAAGEGTKIVVVDLLSASSPFLTRVFEITNLLLLLRIDADNG